MSKDKLGQEPAFPIENEPGKYGNGYTESGMSKRFYAACAIVQGTVINNNLIGQYDFIVKEAYKFADELLKQENE